MQDAILQTEDERSDAFILKNSEGDYVVRPAYAVVDGKTSKKFIIRNLTGSDRVTVTIPSGPIGETRTLGLRGKAVFTLSLTRDVEFIPYTVEVNGRPARGESDPVIIIDPPVS